MKTKIKTVGSVLLIVLAVATGCWLLMSHQTAEPVAKAKVTAPHLNVPQPLPKANDLPKIVQPYARTPYLRLADPRWKEYEIKRKADPSWEWKTPIEFFGKVVDEKDQPVPDATVEIEWNGTIERYGKDGVVHRTIASDANGLITITGIEGKGLTVRVSKEGYHARKTLNNDSFEYAGFWEPNFIEPDRNNPVVFHLVKRRDAEPTYRVGGRLLLPPPSWVTHIDLLRKPAETTGGGDMTVRIIRPPNPGYQNPFDWVLKIESDGGAEFVESNEEFMLRAPDDGYQSAITKSYKQVRGNSTETIRFYVRNKARKLYAAVSLEVTAYYPMINVDKACIIIDATVNPNNSPNLEYDPEKDIREMEKARNR